MDSFHSDEAPRRCSLRGGQARFAADVALEIVKEDANIYWLTTSTNALTM